MLSRGLVVAICKVLCCFMVGLRCMFMVLCCLLVCFV